MRIPVDILTTTTTTSRILKQRTPKTKSCKHLERTLDHLIVGSNLEVVENRLGVNLRRLAYRSKRLLRPSSRHT